MKKQRKILYGFIAFILLAFIGALVFRFADKKRAQLEAEKLNAAPVIAPASQKIKNIYQASRLPLLPKKEEHLSQACADYFAAIRSVDLRLVRTFPPRSSPFPLSETCKDIPKSMGDLDLAYKVACAPLMKANVDLTQKMWFDGLPPCMIAIFNYRAQITHFLTKGIAIEDIDDPKILLDKMMAGMNGTDYKLNGKIAERLLEVEPTLIPAAEMIVLSRFMVAQTESKGNPADKKWEELEHSLAKLIDIGAISSKQVTEWQLMISLSKNPDLEETKRYAEKIAMQYPDWSLPLYYQAWAAYKSDDVSGARKLLESARKLDPSDPRPKEALEKIYKKDPSPFHTVFTVSFPKEVFD